MKSFLRSALTLTALLLTAVPASAQLDANLGSLEGDNAKGYLTPLSGALAATLNSSIFTTANVGQGVFSGHLQVNVMGVSFDDADRTYRPGDPTGFQSTETVDAPTVIGDTQAVEQSGQNGTVLYHPGGFDLENFTIAAPQLELSGFLGSRALIRWISVDLGDADLGSLELFGLGVQHSISQYLAAPPVDLAVGVFWQSFKIGDGLVDADALQFMAMASKQYSVIEPYVGLGFDMFDMQSEYTDDSSGENVAVDFDPESNVHMTAGARLNLKYVQIHGEFNVAAETGVAVGLALGY